MLSFSGILQAGNRNMNESVEALSFGAELVTFATNHFIMTMIWVLGFGYLIWLQINIMIDGIKSVDHNKMAYLMNSKGMGIVDIRSGEEYRKGHIPGSVSVEVSEIEKQNFSLIEKYRNSGVVIVGKTYGDSEAYNCAKVLKKNGFKNTFLLDGGILDWNGSGLPTATGK